MKWEGQRESDNVVDERGSGGGGGGGGMRFGGGRGVGIGGIVVALLASWAFGINPMTVLGLMGGGAPTEQQAPQQAPSKPQDPAARFASVVLADTEDVWTAYFAQMNERYQAPQLHIFRGSTRTACGRGESAMGPFYCPGDGNVYIDLSFNETLSRQLGAPGDFAQAYVIAHEVGHHLQNLMGTSEKVQQARSRGSERQANAMSVRLELQADCYAGVWAHHSQKGKGWLEAGDIEEGLNAASQIGDDTLQRRGQGTVVPESFTHGSSAQRVQWFKRGMESGDIKSCDTFSTRS